jgi:hypothetical protein
MLHLCYQKSDGTKKIIKDYERRGRAYIARY